MVRERSFTCRETQNSVIPEVIDTLRGNDPNSSFVILEDRKNMAVAEAIDRVEVIQTPIDKSIETLVSASQSTERHSARERARILRRYGRRFPEPCRESSVRLFDEADLHPARFVSAQPKAHHPVVLARLVTRI